jgi:hypothetical protein
MKINCLSSLKDAYDELEIDAFRLALMFYHFQERND